MTNLEAHHDLALMLLVGRSLDAGIPWTLDEDQEHISREQVLWASLAPDEQSWEQGFLSSLWRGDRMVPVNPEWGEWTSKVPPTVAVVDDAFGLPQNAYLPNPKGKFDATPFPEFARVFEWVWERGFQVVAVTGPQSFLMTVPAHRVVQEADRLASLLSNASPALEAKMRPHGDIAGGVQLRSSYDPVRQASVLEVAGLTDDLLPD